MSHDQLVGYNPNAMLGYGELPPVLGGPDPQPVLPAGRGNVPTAMFDPNMPFELEGGVAAIGSSPRSIAPGVRRSRLWRAEWRPREWRLRPGNWCAGGGAMDTWKVGGFRAGDPDVYRRGATARR